MMTTNTPIVSVIMPVYNAENYIKETMESILNQSLKDFEFIIIDDASTDASAEIIESYHDRRIRFYKNAKNTGYAAGLNRMIELARGEFIARQDNDDISHPDRLRTQVAFLRKFPEIGVCGSFAHYIGEKKGVFKRPVKNESIRAKLLFYCPMIHPSVMMRASLFKDQGIKYSTALAPAEDYNLWFDISKASKITNIPKPLLNWRIHEKSASRVQKKNQTMNAHTIRNKIIEYSLQTKMKDEEKFIHSKISDPYTMEREDLYKAQKWLLKLQDLNRTVHYYDPISLQNAVFEAWSETCRNNHVISPLDMILIYYKSDLVNIYRLFSRESAKTFLKNLIKFLRGMKRI